MLTDRFDNFSFLVTICDSLFFSVRNEPRICFQKSVIFVCKGRATYLIGFQKLDVLLPDQESTDHQIRIGPRISKFYPALCTTKWRHQFESQPQNLCFEGILGLQYVFPMFVHADCSCSQSRNSWKHQLLQASRTLDPNWRIFKCG